MSIQDSLAFLYKLQKWHSTLPSAPNLSDAKLSLLQPAQIESLFPLERISDVGSYTYSENILDTQYILEKLGIGTDLHLHCASSATSLIKMVGFLAAESGIQTAVLLNAAYPTWCDVLRRFGIQVEILRDISELDGCHAGKKRMVLVHDPAFGTSRSLCDGHMDYIAAIAANSGDLFVFDCILDPHFSRHHKSAAKIESAIYITSPFKVVGSNSIKVSFLLCKGLLSRRLDRLIFSIGEDLNYTAQLALRAFHTDIYDTIRNSTRGTLESATSTVRATVHEYNCVTDATSPHLFASVTVPDILMTQLMTMQAHEQLYLRAGILFIPSGLYSMSNEGRLQFRVNLGKTWFDYKTLLPTFMRNLRQFAHG